MSSGGTASPAGMPKEYIGNSGAGAVPVQQFPAMQLPAVPPATGATGSSPTTNPYASFSAGAYNPNPYQYQPQYQQQYQMPSDSFYDQAFGGGMQYQQPYQQYQQQYQPQYQQPYQRMQRSYGFNQQRNAYPRQMDQRGLAGLMGGMGYGMPQMGYGGYGRQRQPQPQQVFSDMRLNQPGSPEDPNFGQYQPPSTEINSRYQGPGLAGLFGGMNNGPSPPMGGFRNEVPYGSPYDSPPQLPPDRFGRRRGDPDYGTGGPGYNPFANNLPQPELQAYPPPPDEQQLLRRYE